MEGFTLGLALVDAIPVLAFAGSMAIIAARFDSPLFMVGAGLSILAGCCKVAWKLILGIRRINWAGVLGALVSFPAVLFFVAWIFLMGFMGWYRKNKFKNDDAHSNWTAQIINAVGQLCLLLGILTA